MYFSLTWPLSFPRSAHKNSTGTPPDGQTLTFKGKRLTFHVPTEATASFFLLLFFYYFLLEYTLIYRPFGGDCSRYLNDSFKAHWHFPSSFCMLHWTRKIHSHLYTYRLKKEPLTDQSSLVGFSYCFSKSYIFCPFPLIVVYLKWSSANVLHTNTVSNKSSHESPISSDQVTFKLDKYWISFDCQHKGVFCSTFFRFCYRSCTAEASSFRKRRYPHWNIERMQW